MSRHYHAVLWIDHHEARVICFNADEADETVLHPPHPPRHLHVKAGSPAGTHLRGEDQFYREVAATLSDAHAFLVTGPSTAKEELVAYLRENAPKTLARMRGITTVDRLTDRQLLAKARHYFKANDRMTPRIE